MLEQSSIKERSAQTLGSNKFRCSVSLNCKHKVQKMLQEGELDRTHLFLPTLLVKAEYNYFEPANMHV